MNANHQTDHELTIVVVAIWIAALAVGAIYARPALIILGWGM